MKDYVFVLLKTNRIVDYDTYIKKYMNAKLNDVIHFQIRKGNSNQNFSICFYGSLLLSEELLSSSPEDASFSGEKGFDFLFVQIYCEILQCNFGEV